MTSRFLAALALGSVLAGCATARGTTTGGAPDAGDAGALPDAEPDDGGGFVVGCPDGGTTTLTGVVRDPAGLNPLYNVLVYVPKEPPLAFKDGVICDRCGALASGKPITDALTDSSGHFELSDVPAGKNIPLVIQVGKWRRQVTLPEVKSCQVNEITDPELTRLPRNKLEGDLPRIAIATGSADPFECLLTKIGIDPAELTRPTDNGRVHVYVALGGVQVDPPAPTAAALWNDLATLERYDIVILPCEGEPAADEKSAAARQALVDYTNAGGRLFTTHFGYEWIAHGAAPFPSSGQWNPDQGDVADPLHAHVETTFPKGEAFAEWLQHVGASTTLGSIDLVEPRHDLDGPANGSTAWINASAFNGGPSVQELTFNTPIGAPDAQQCGRVVYSNFHVSAASRIPAMTFPDSCLPSMATAQEKALEFMLFDLSSCIDKDTDPPTPPPR